MERINLNIYFILAKDEYIYDKQPDVSEPKKIKVNKNPDGSYYIKFVTQNLIFGNQSTIMSKIVEIFKANLPDKGLNIRLIPEDKPDALGRIETKAVLHFDELLQQLCASLIVKGTNDQYMVYQPNNIMDQFKEIANNEAFSNECEYYEQCDTDEPEDTMEYEDDDMLEDDGKKLWRYLVGDKNNKSKHKKTKKIKVAYGRSRILSKAKNSKKSYERHGVIICNNKKDAKRDRKIIKEFLKDFFPGNSKWKKDFRDDVLDRWMRMYTVSEKRLKELEKKAKKNSKSKSKKSISKENTRRILDITNRIFNVPMDCWNDPNK